MLISQISQQHRTEMENTVTAFTGKIDDQKSEIFKLRTELDEAVGD